MYMLKATVSLVQTAECAVVTYLAEVVGTWRSDGLIKQFLTADAFKQLAHFLHEFLSPAQH